MRGYTLVEWVFLVAVLAAFSGLIGLFACDGSSSEEGEGAESSTGREAGVSRLQQKRTQVICLNNLRQIGGLLVCSGDNRKFKHSGAPFLLQIADEIKDDQLNVFLCPGETMIPASRPDVGTDDFVAMYRTNSKNLAKLDHEQLRVMCSYAGPNWEDYPYDWGATEARVWGCDACQGMKPHHKGICLLFDDGSVRFLEIADLEGQAPDQIFVGPGSGDPRLEKMVFCPRQR